MVAKVPFELSYDMISSYLIQKTGVPADNFRQENLTLKEDGLHFCVFTGTHRSPQPQVIIPAQLQNTIREDLSGIPKAEEITIQFTFSDPLAPQTDGFGSCVLLEYVCFDNGAPVEPTQTLGELIEAHVRKQISSEKLTIMEVVHCKPKGRVGQMSVCMDAYRSARQVIGIRGQPGVDSKYGTAMFERTTLQVNGLHVVMLALTQHHASGNDVREPPSRFLSATDLCIMKASLFEMKVPNKFTEDIATLETLCKDILEHNGATPRQWSAAMVDLICLQRPETTGRDTLKLNQGEADDINRALKADPSNVAAHLMLGNIGDSTAMNAALNKAEQLVLDKTGDKATVEELLEVAAVLRNMRKPSKAQKREFRDMWYVLDPRSTHEQTHDAISIKKEKEVSELTLYHRVLAHPDVDGYAKYRAYVWMGRMAEDIGGTVLIDQDGDEYYAKHAHQLYVRAMETKSECLANSELPAARHRLAICLPEDRQIKISDEWFVAKVLQEKVNTIAKDLKTKYSALQQSDEWKKRAVQPQPVPHQPDRHIPGVQVPMPPFPTLYSASTNPTYDDDMPPPLGDAIGSPELATVEADVMSTTHLKQPHLQQPLDMQTSHYDPVPAPVSLPAPTPAPAPATTDAAPTFDVPIESVQDLMLIQWPGDMLPSSVSVLHLCQNAYRSKTSGDKDKATALLLLLEHAKANKLDKVSLEDGIMLAQKKTSKIALEIISLDESMPAAFDEVANSLTTGRVKTTKLPGGDKKWQEAEVREKGNEVLLALCASNDAAQLLQAATEVRRRIVAGGLDHADGISVGDETLFEEALYQQILALSPGDAMKYRVLVRLGILASDLGGEVFLVEDELDTETPMAECFIQAIATCPDAPCAYYLLADGVRDMRVVISNTEMDSATLKQRGNDRLLEMLHKNQA